MTDALDHIDHDEEAGAPNRPDTLWVTDAELIRRLGVPPKIAREALRMYDRDPKKGFPQKVGTWGNRRYWPAVKAYLDATCGLKMTVPQGRNGL